MEPPSRSGGRWRRRGEDHELAAVSGRKLTEEHGRELIEQFGFVNCASGEQLQLQLHSAV